jgi:hypothetical protein
MTPEGKIKVEIKRILAEYSVYYCMPAGTGYGHSGIADFCCCINGHFLAIEAKAGSKQPTALQQQELDKVDAAGGVAICINAENIFHLPTLLEEIIKCS